MEKSFLILSALMLTLINSLHVPSFILGAQADINIACGAKESFTDPVCGMDWADDDQFIEYGSVENVTFTSPDAPFLSTVRYFPNTGVPNYCYTIRGVTMGNNITVRAIFLYGNYDGLALPPSFGLQIDGSKWAEVETSMDVNLVVYGMTYWAVADTVSVCLAPDATARVPFISAIQIREAPPSPSTEAPPNPGAPSPSRDTSPPITVFNNTILAPAKASANPSPNASPKGKLDGFIYLVTLLPGGTLVTLVVSVITWLSQLTRGRSLIQHRETQMKFR